MRAHPPIALAFALVTLAACARDTTSTAASTPPVSSDPLGTSMQSPQSPNSLPAGAAINAPLTSPTGVVATTST